MSELDSTQQQSGTLRSAPCPSMTTEVIWNYPRSQEHISILNSDTICVLAEGNSHSNITPKKMLSANPRLIAFLYKTHPGIRLVSYIDNKKGIISGFQSWIVDFSFAAGDRDILVSIEENKYIWIHTIEDTDNTLKPDVLHKIYLPQMQSICEVKISGVAFKNLENFYDGYLVMSVEYDLIALHMKNLRNDTIHRKISDSQLVSLGECDGLFDVSRDGQKVASYREGTIAIFLLPSPAIHSFWSPCEDLALDVLSFGIESNIVITSSIAENSLRIWDIGESDPFCKHKIIFPFSEFRVVSSPFSQNLFLFRQDCDMALEIDMLDENRITESILDRKICAEDLRGISITSNDDGSKVFCRFSNKISSFFSKKEGISLRDTAFKKPTCLKDRLNNRSDQLHDLNFISTEYTSLQNGENKLNGFGTDHKHSKILDIDVNNGKDEIPKVDDSSYGNVSAESNSSLVEAMNQTTKAVIRMTKVLTKYQKAVSDLKSFSSKISTECKRIIKKSMKEYTAECALSLSYTKHVEKEFMVSISRSLAPILALSLHNINLVDLHTFEDKIIRYAKMSFDNLQENLVQHISNACLESMSAVDLMSCSESLSQLNREIFSHSIEISSVSAAIADKEFNKAIEIVLETRSLKMLVWLLTEAQEIHFWSELIVDEALSPITVLSLVYNICVALTTFSRIYPANLSEELLIFVRDAVVTYRIQWTDRPYKKLYKQLSGYCSTLLHSIENDDTQGPLYSCLREAVRLMEV